MLLSVKKEVLSKKRKDYHLSQYRLSILSGLSGNAIYRMENKNHKVNIFRAKAVAETLKCTVDDLFNVSK